MNGNAESVMDFVPRYQQYQSDRDRTEMLLKDLMIHCEQVERSLHQSSSLRQENSLLASQLQDTKLDYDDLAKSHHELKQRTRDLEFRLGQTSVSGAVASPINPYAVVLIDGNKLLFKENLIRKGLNGGKKAANALHKAILHKFATTDKLEVVAKVFADFSELSKAMMVEGLVDSKADFREFMLGFTRAKTTFDWIDVETTRADGSKMKDSKIKETIRRELRNPDCQNILLGVSHNASYAPFLDDIIHDGRKQNRISIIEGYPVVPELVAVEAEIVTFNDIFRSQRPVDRSPSVTSSSTALSSSPSSSPPTGISYATVTQAASSPPHISLPLGPKFNAVFNKVGAAAKISSTTSTTWIPGRRGLDLPIPINQAVLDTIKRRKDSDKLCNNHYLRGPCAKGDACCFEHNYKPNQDELRAISFLARLNPCTNGQDCEVENCIYGHHCPSVVNGVCTHPFCKFHDHEHPAGTKLKNGKRVHEF